MSAAAAPIFLRGVPVLRLQQQQQYQRIVLSYPAGARRAWCCGCSGAAESNGPVEVKSTPLLNAKEAVAKIPRWDDPDYRKWKDKENEILRDIDPIRTLTKEIIHSNRYVDGERLSVEDEKAVVEKLLKYHPHAEDKIGCGIDSIMVDRHPQFRFSRCLFVVRTDGVWIDFSYQKCLRAYVRKRYPSHAERFIRQHFKRGSG